MEHWEALKPGGYQFVYEDALFRPGTDTFLLSSLPRLKAGLRVCDLGCGTGLLGLLLLQRQPALSVTGIDIQPEAIHLAEKVVIENGLENRLSFLQGDLRDALLPANSFDLVVCNPPYYPTASGKLSSSQSLRTARSEESCTLEELCRAAARLLPWSGHFCLVHKPERLTDLCCTLRTCGLEPKRLRMVCKTAASAPSLLLLDACRGGKPGLSVEAPLILQNSDGSPSAEVDAIYFRTQQEDTP